jgi:hypothetical protein
MTIIVPQDFISHRIIFFCNEQKKEVADIMKDITTVSKFVDWEEMRVNYAKEYELIKNQGTEKTRMGGLMPFKKENTTRQLKRKRKRPKGETTKTHKKSKSGKKHTAHDFFYPPSKGKGKSGKVKEVQSTTKPSSQTTQHPSTQPTYPPAAFNVETVSPRTSFPTSHSKSPTDHPTLNEKYQYSTKSKKSKSHFRRSSKSKYSSKNEYEYLKGGVKGKKCKTTKNQNEDDDYYYYYYYENEDEDDAGAIAYGRRLKQSRPRAKSPKRGKEPKSAQYNSIKTTKEPKSAKYDSIKTTKNGKSKNHGVKSNKSDNYFDDCDEFETFSPSPLPSISNHPSLATFAPSSNPTSRPATPFPTSKPTPTPSRSPDSPPITPSPTSKPTSTPSRSPSSFPTRKPSTTPSRSPASLPTTDTPSGTPSRLPSLAPSTLSPTKEQIYRYDRGACPGPGSEGVPCSEEDLRKKCDRYNGGSFRECW